MSSEQTQVDALRRSITDEFLIALGLTPHSRLRRWLEPLIAPPVTRFARMAFDFDQRIALSGLVEAARHLVSPFVNGIVVCGAESIPAEGPLLVASNHPGAYDSLALAASLGRDDLKIVVSGVDMLRRLPETARHMIYVASDVPGRWTVVRETIRHLQAGGAALIFPTGLVDPDPEQQPGSDEALDSWSPSLSLILSRVPQTCLVPAIVSGVLARACLRNPIARLPKAAWEKRKLAEFLQVSQQLAFHRSFSLTPHISFGRPMTATDLRRQAGSQGLLPAVIENARSLLAAHLALGAGACAEQTVGA